MWTASIGQRPLKRQMVVEPTVSIAKVFTTPGPSTPRNVDENDGENGDSDFSQLRGSAADFSPLRALNRVCTKKQLEYMIWEVDENLDGCVDWDEFQMMYYRNMTDTPGLEPFELFNIVQARAAFSPAPLPPPDEGQPP